MDSQLIMEVAVSSLNVKTDLDSKDLQCCDGSGGPDFLAGMVLIVISNVIFIICRVVAPRSPYH